MKLLAMLLAAAGLSGCVAYGPGYYDGGYYGGHSGGYYGQSVPYVVEQPLYIYGSGGYHYDSHAHRPGGRRDRDGDGVPNRLDRDRDGDGVNNRRDAYPNNPRRR